MRNVRYRIGGFHTGALYGVAIVGDVLQFLITLIPIIGFILSSLVSMLLYIVFWVWFRLLGVGMTEHTDTLIARIGIGIAEALPIVNALPGWTLAVALTIYATRKSDEKKARG